MATFKVTFKNEETGKTKSYKVRATGIVPAIETAIRKALLLGWTIISAEMVL